MLYQLPSETKTLFNLSAPVHRWSGWTTIYTQYEIFGASDAHVTEVDIHFFQQAHNKGLYNYEIKGADNFIQGIGPGGRAKAFIRGNVNAYLKIRVRGSSGIPNTNAPAIKVIPVTPLNK